MTRDVQRRQAVSALLIKNAVFLKIYVKNFGISVKSALRNHSAIAFYQPHCDKT